MLPGNSLSKSRVIVAIHDQIVTDIISTEMRKFIIVNSLSLLSSYSTTLSNISSEPLYKDYFADNEEEAHKYAFAANSLIMGYFTVDYFLRMISHPIMKE